MSFGALTPEQVEALRPYVKSQVVHDLGAGDLAWSRKLLTLGAAKVIAVDKESFVKKPAWGRGRPFQFIQRYFQDFPDPVDVAWVSWPTNSQAIVGLPEIVSRSRIVIYLGCNTGGTACGTQDLFREFLRREVLAYVPDPRNTLIVYGEHLAEDEGRFPLGEELAALSTNTYDFQEVEDRVAAEDFQQAIRERRPYKRWREAMKPTEDGKSMRP